MDNQQHFEIKPIVSKVAWRSSDNISYSQWNGTFNQESINEIIFAVKQIKIQQSQANKLDENFYATLELPALRAICQHLVEELEHGLGFFRLAGFPLEHLQNQDLETAFLLLGHVLGTPVSQTTEGEKVVHIQDKGYKLGEPMARGINTRVALDFHTDSCDVPALLCVRKAESGGVSRIVSSVSIHNAILEKNEQLAKVLYEPYYWLRPDWFDKKGDSFYPMPIFTSCQGYFSSRYLRLFIEYAQENPVVPRLTEQQIEALDAIDQLTKDPNYFMEIPFEQGDIYFVNDHVTYHMRTEYKDYNSPELKRDLLRLWLSVPNSRPLSPYYLPLFNRIEAGAIRGGIPI